MFARTPRLLLRPGWPEDAPAVFNAIDDHAVARNLSAVPWPYTISDAEQFLASARPVRHPNFLIFRRTAGAPKLVGSIGFGDGEEGQLEMGYWISRYHWGLGYATEAGRAVLDIAQALGHAEIRAEHYLDNPASGNVLRKLGFTATGRVCQRYSKGREKKVDTAEYRLGLAEDDADCGAMRSLAA